MIITYTWTNHSDESKSVDLAVTEKAFQDDIELEHAIILSYIYQKSLCKYLKFSCG